MIEYLLHAQETHALISNHLATAIAALVRWHLLTGDARALVRGRELLNRVLSYQSKEGWFLEYQGADPGYQSLCICYLADVHVLRPDWQLLEPLRNAILFLWHFAHPDGSFGGLYGSRCTRFYYPAGVLALANEIPEAVALADFMEKSIENQLTITLSTIDEPNLIPMFNSYCWAATLAIKPSKVQVAPRPILPALQREAAHLYYKEAGILIDRGKEHYSIIGTSKGGVVYHFTLGNPPLIDAGIVVSNSRGKLGSSQGFNQAVVKEVEGELIIVTNIVSMPKRSPEPWQFLLIRIMCASIFRYSKLREFFKQVLVRLLITDGVTWPLKNRRIIKYGKSLSIIDQLESKSGYKAIDGIAEFVPIHMASQGYWQRQDEI